MTLKIGARLNPGQLADGNITFNEAESQTTERNEVLTITANIPPSATAIGHSHPEKGGSAASGPRDDAAVRNGRPNYIYPNGRVVIVEPSGWQYRVRVVNGRLTSREKENTQKQLNKYQERE